MKRPSGLQALAAALAVVAGAAHLTSTPEHLAIWTPGGAFFAASGVMQMGLAVALFAGLERVGRLRTVAFGLWANVAVIAVYLVSRTAGIPFAPPYSAHGGPFRDGQSIVSGGLEPVRSFDLFVLFVEVLLVLSLVELSSSNERRRHTTVLSIAGAGLWTLLLFRLLA